MNRAEATLNSKGSEMSEMRMCRIENDEEGVHEAFYWFAPTGEFFRDAKDVMPGFVREQNFPIDRVNELPEYYRTLIEHCGMGGA